MWFPEKDIMTRDGNSITIKMLNHPRCVSLFIRNIKRCLLEQYTDIHLILQPSVVYPNACVPVAGIIQHYISKGITFSYENQDNSYLAKCSFEIPLSFSDEDDLERAFSLPLGKIFVFNSSLQTAKLAQAYTDTSAGL